MPIYEYECRQCCKRSTFLILNLTSPQSPQCRHCGSNDLEKLISRVRMLKSDEARLESLADPSKLAGLDENDPVSMARWMKKMGKEMGEEFAGDELEQMIDEAAHEAEGGEGTADTSIPSGDSGDF
ncbi:MAG: zinc ribbon domain-containing protein [bacterium]